MDRSKGLEYLHAGIIRLPPEITWKTVILIGCGGTGGWLAPAITRIAYVLKQKQEELHLIFVDPDVVEEINIGRQNFCPAEIGRNKAEALAVRYGTAWGVEIAAIPEPWEKVKSHIDVHGFGEGTLLVGCVDNAHARRQIATNMNTRSVWWLDCGNGKDNGQVLLGNIGQRDALKDAFPSKKLCLALPAPHIQEPTLLVPRPDEMADVHLSCAELAALNAQSLAVNQRVAAEATDMMVRLLVTKDLKRYAVYFDLASGTATAKYATKEAVMSYLPKKKEKKGSENDKPDD
jgi:PRTRC genetic system ThiF family protein